MAWHVEVPDALPPGSQVQTSDELFLVPEPRNVSVAREWVAERLPAWAGPEVQEAVELLTSELVTNGVVHARTQLHVGIVVTAHDVVVGVHDLDLGHREPRGQERHGGWGLHLVHQLATTWGQVHHTGGGKTIWFRVSA